MVGIVVSFLSFDFWGEVLVLFISSVTFMDEISKVCVSFSLRSLKSLLHYIKWLANDWSEISLSALK